MGEFKPAKRYVALSTVALALHSKCFKFNKTLTVAMAIILVVTWRFAGMNPPNVFTQVQQFA